MSRLSDSQCYLDTFANAGYQHAFRIYRHPQSKSGRRLLLIHGAGVAGRFTWEALQCFLDGWSEILVPDLRGAGETISDNGIEHPFSVNDLVSDMTYLVDHLEWHEFDLAGYSLGGLVSLLMKQNLRDRVRKQYLLESALLDRKDWQETVSVRQSFSVAAKRLRETESDEGIRTFLDTISPNRKVSEAVERMTLQRLGERRLGFANSLDAVTNAALFIDRESLLAAQGDVSSFIGGLSVEPMHQLHQSLSDSLRNWHYHFVAGTDHSLPYQKPRQIARIMNDELKRYLSGY
jgi:pimeloyl-ACP methyl ester carboxylesterase